MKEKPSLGYSLALYISTVMWIVGMVGIFGVCVGLGIEIVREYQYQETIDQLDLSHEEYRLATAEMEEGRILWRKISRPIEGDPRFPIPFFLCCFIAGAGYRIRKGMGEPVGLAELFR